MPFYKTDRLLEEILSSTDCLLCLPETDYGSWVRFTNFERVELRLKKGHPPAAGSKLGETFNSG
jgi:hypothetical protein